MAHKLKVALVHDWLVDFGGAERLLLALRALYPAAPIFTAFYDATKLPQFQDAQIQTSYLQKIPFAKERHRFFLPFMPAAIEQFDLSAFDLVISSTSSGCAKGVLTSSKTTHICYCHNPSRVLWDRCQAYLKLHQPNFLLRKLLPRQLTKLRIWDRVAADRVDYFLANSNFVAQRIRKYYQREAEVIYPPVETAKFLPSGEPPRDYFLAIGRLVPYKRFDLIVAAANKLKLNLRVVGTGPELARLQALAGPTVRFLGQVSESLLRKMCAECQALIFPQVEDFGLTPVEVNASGRPVIAFAQGGACESLLPNKTGVFFPQQEVGSLVQAIEHLRKRHWNARVLAKQAARFDSRHFQAQISAFVERVMA